MNVRSPSLAGTLSPTALIFLLALLLRGIYFAQSLDNPLLYMPVLDEVYYIDLGRAISEGLLIGEKRAFFMDPLYGYLLGLFFFLFGEDLLPVRIFQVLLDSFSAVLVYRLGSAVWNHRAGLAAGLFYAVYKVAFFNSLLVLKTTLGIHLLLLFVLCLASVARAGGWVRWSLLGLFGGAIVYLQASFLLLIPLAALFYGIVERPGTILWLRNCLVFAAGAVLILSAGALRNHRVTGEWIWLNTQSGRLFYISNNPGNLTGRYNVPSFSRPHPEDSETDFHREAERRSGRRLTPSDVSDYWMNRSLEFLRGDPAAALLLLKNKVRETLADYEIPNNHSFELAGRFSSVARWPLPTFALALAVGIPGIAIGLRSRRQVGWALIPILTVLFTIILFYSSSRFRMPAVPFLIIGAGIGVERLLDWVRRREWLKIAAGTAVGLGLFTVSMGLSDPRGSGTEEFFLAKAYWSQKNYGEAENQALEGVRRFPSQARFPALLGMTALSEGRYEDAIRHNLRAVELDPVYADAHHNLGLAYLMSGRPGEAVESVNRALALSRNPRFLFTLGNALEAKGEREEAVRSYKGYLEGSKPNDPYRGTARDRLRALDRGRG
ncbi:MAG: tetratricopeptide repeat protein [Thermodesulfobacteriota bacterium]